MAQPRILITGATGFVGSYLLRLLLREGYTNIVALHRDQSRMDLVAPIRKKVEWVECDLLDILAIDKVMHNIDWVIHTASLISYRSSDSQRLLRNNVEGTENMINAALAHPVQKFLHMSSIAALGLGRGHKMIDEHSVWQNTSARINYRLSKHLAEMEVWRGFAEGLPVLIVNPSTILGAGFWYRGSPALFSRIWKGLPGYPSGSTGFVDVRDVARVCIKLLERDLTGERFIVNAENLSYEHLIKKVCKAFGKAPPVRHLRGWRAHLISRLLAVRAFFTGRPAPFSREMIRNTSLERTFDNSKVCSTLSFSFLPLEKTIRDTVKSYQSAMAQDQDFGRLDF